MSVKSRIDTSDLWHFCTILGKICEVTSQLESDPHYTKEEAVEGLKDVIHDLDPLYQRGVYGSVRPKDTSDHWLMWHISSAISHMHMIILQQSEGNTRGAEENMRYVLDLLESVYETRSREAVESERD